jgi:F-type H+-transporting ATPase subunit delta
MLLEIIEEVIVLYKKKNKIETVKVTTAEPLEDELKEEIIKFIQSQTNKKIEIEKIIDKKIIAGTIITMQDKQLDISISTAINALKQKFSTNLYIKDF